MKLVFLVYNVIWTFEFLFSIAFDFLLTYVLATAFSTFHQQTQKEVIFSSSTFQFQLITEKVHNKLNRNAKVWWEVSLGPGFIETQHDRQNE